MTKFNTMARIIGNKVSSNVEPKLHYINVSITNKCNLKCIMCDTRKFNKFEDMSLKTFKKIIDGAVPLGLEVVNLAATGESTLHKDFCKMVDYADEKGVKLRLVTNLNHMTPKIEKALNKFEVIHISVDGATKETYEKIRKGASWENMMENIIKIKAKKIINFCLQDKNKHELDLIGKTFGGYEINIGNLKGTERLDYDVKKMPCYHYHFNLYIAPNGSCYPCCLFEYYESLNGQSLMCAGNVNNDTIEDIWKGEMMRNMRVILINKYFPSKVCKDCTFGINKEIDKYAKWF